MDTATAALATIIIAIVISQTTNNFGDRRQSGCNLAHAPEHCRSLEVFHRPTPNSWSSSPDWEPHLCQQPGLFGGREETGNEWDGGRKETFVMGIREPLPLPQMQLMSLYPSHPSSAMSSPAWPTPEFTPKPSSLTREVLYLPGPTLLKTFLWLPSTKMERPRVHLLISPSP